MNMRGLSNEKKYIDYFRYIDVGKFVGMRKK